MTSVATELTDSPSCLTDLTGVTSSVTELTDSPSCTAELFAESVGQ